jgi:hypothetical protein
VAAAGVRALLAHEIRARNILTDEFVYERLASPSSALGRVRQAARDFPFFLYSIAFAPAFFLSHARHCVRPREDDQTPSSSRRCASPSS